MLNDGKEEVRGGLRPAGSGERVTHFWDAANELRELGTGLVPPGGEDN